MFRTASPAADLHRADPRNLEAVAKGSGRKARRRDAARHHHLPRAQAASALCEMVRQPRQRHEGMAERIGAAAARQLRAVLPDDADHLVEAGRRRHERAQNDPCIPRIVGHQRRAVERPVVGVAVLHQLDRRGHGVDRSTRAFRGERCAVRRQVAAEPDAGLELEAEVVVVGKPEMRAGSEHPPREDGPGDGMVDAAHLLHAPRRQADLVAGDAVVPDDARDMGVLRPVGVGQPVEPFQPVEARAVAVLRNQRRGDPVDCLRQRPASCRSNRAPQ